MPLLHLRLSQHRRAPLGLVGQVDLVAEGVRMRRLGGRRPPRQVAEGRPPAAPRRPDGRSAVSSSAARAMFPAMPPTAADPDAHGAQSGTFTASQDVRTASASVLVAP